MAWAESLEVSGGAVRFRPAPQEGIHTVEGLLECDEELLVVFLQEGHEAGTIPYSDSEQPVQFEVLGGLVKLKRRTTTFKPDSGQPSGFVDLCQALLVSPSWYGYVFSADLRVKGWRGMFVGFDDESHPTSRVEFLHLDEPHLRLSFRERKTFAPNWREFYIRIFWEWPLWPTEPPYVPHQLSSREETNRFLRHRERVEKALKLERLRYKDKRRRKAIEDKAIELHEQNVKENSEQWESYQFLGSIYRQRGLIREEVRVREKQISVWENLLEMGTGSTEALEGLYKRLEEAKELQRAICYYCGSEYEAEGRPLHQRMFCSEDCRRAWLAAEGISESGVRQPKYDQRRLDDDMMGWFYVVQLLPKVAPNRIKMGWSKNPGKRLWSFLVPCPLARLLRKWPCHVDDERHLIGLLTQGCGRGSVGYSTEVFDVDDLDKLLERCDRLIERRKGK